MITVLDLRPRAVSTPPYNRISVCIGASGRQVNLTAKELNGGSSVLRLLLVRDPSLRISVEEPGMISGAVGQSFY
jgi:hypothetical protein